MNPITLLQKTNPKTRIIVLMILILILSSVVGGLIWRITTGKLAKKETQVTEEDILFKGKPTVVFEMGQIARLGSLEITVYNAKESSYLSLDLDENYQRITKSYLAVQIKVFNPSNDQTENLLIGLIDDRGNKYNLDPGVSSYIPDLREFGRNMNIYPRIIQEGYIFFSNLDEGGKEVQLIFAIASTKEKIAFKVER